MLIPGVHVVGDGGDEGSSEMSSPRTVEGSSAMKSFERKDCQDCQFSDCERKFLLSSSHNVGSDNRGRGMWLVIVAGEGRNSSSTVMTVLLY